MPRSRSRSPSASLTGRSTSPKRSRSPSRFKSRDRSPAGRWSRSPDRGGRRRSPGRRDLPPLRCRTPSRDRSPRRRSPIGGSRHDDYRQRRSSPHQSRRLDSENRSSGFAGKEFIDSLSSITHNLNSISKKLDLQQQQHHYQPQQQQFAYEPWSWGSYQYHG